MYEYNLPVTSLTLSSSSSWIDGPFLFIDNFRTGDAILKSSSSSMMEDRLFVLVSIGSDRRGAVGWTDETVEINGKLSSSLILTSDVKPGSSLILMADGKSGSSLILMADGKSGSSLILMADGKLGSSLIVMADGESCSSFILMADGKPGSSFIIVVGPD
jgi:hypothetical protein